MIHMNMNPLNYDIKCRINIRKFISFLKRNNCYESYLKYTNYSNFYHRIINNPKHILYAIDFSFTWSKTKEGHAYWHDLYNKWQLEYATLI